MNKAKFNVPKFNVYYVFLIILNFLALLTVFFDAKGIVIMLLTIGFSLLMHLLVTIRSYLKRIAAAVEGIEFAEEEQGFSTLGAAD